MQTIPLPCSAAVLVCHDPMVLDALRFIKAGARDCLQVEEVAEHVRVSRSTLARLFKQELGRSVSSEIKREQVEEVKRLLTQTRDAIEDISRACGFSSAGQLSRFFKREVGVSPSEWRRGERVPGALDFLARGAGKRCVVLSRELAMT